MQTQKGLGVAIFYGRHAAEAALLGFEPLLWQKKLTGFHFAAFAASVFAAQMKDTPRAYPTIVNFFKDISYNVCEKEIQTAGHKKVSKRQKNLLYFHKFHNCSNICIHRGRYVHSSHTLEKLPPGDFEVL